MIRIVCMISAFVWLSACDEPTEPVEDMFTHIMMHDEFFKVAHRYDGKVIRIRGFLYQNPWYGAAMRLFADADQVGGDTRSYWIAPGLEKQFATWLPIWDSSRGEHLTYSDQRTGRCGQSYVEILGQMGWIEASRFYGITDIYAIKAYDNHSLEGEGYLCFEQGVAGLPPPNADTVKAIIDAQIKAYRESGASP